MHNTYSLSDAMILIKLPYSFKITYCFISFSYKHYMRMPVLNIYNCVEYIKNCKNSVYMRPTMKRVSKIKYYIYIYISVLLQFCKWYFHFIKSKSIWYLPLGFCTISTDLCGFWWGLIRFTKVISSLGREHIKLFYQHCLLRANRGQ